MVDMDVHQPPLNTTLMGVIKGAADYYGKDLSVPVLFGRTGHAFALNIAPGLCPSAPYVWNMEKLDRLLDNCGLEIIRHGFFDGESSPRDRKKLEDILRCRLSEGRPCAMLNLDNQLISGFDETGFLCVQPWKCDFPPAHLTFGSWSELQDEIHICFFSFNEKELPQPLKAAADSLECALDMANDPESYAMPGYTFGPRAYETWKKAIEEGHGVDHGGWWNGTVWSECRAMASEYFKHLGKTIPNCSSESMELAEIYHSIAKNLKTVSDNEEDPGKKMQLLDRSREMEEKAMGSVGELINMLQG